MGASGTATLNFGAFPGASDTSIDVVTAGVVVTSLVEAWMHGGTATADHAIDEHMVETIKVWARYLSDGNIRIFGLNTNWVLTPAEPLPPRTRMVSGTTATTVAFTIADTPPGKSILTPQGTRIYGLWTVAWVWN